MGYISLTAAARSDVDDKTEGIDTASRPVGGIYTQQGPVISLRRATKADYIQENPIPRRRRKMEFCLIEFHRGAVAADEQAIAGSAAPRQACPRAGPGRAGPGRPGQDRAAVNGPRISSSSSSPPGDVVATPPAGGGGIVRRWLLGDKWRTGDEPDISPEIFVSGWIVGWWTIMTDV